jgi:glycosyltransferase involved in cell wall biosynthesis
MKILHVLADWKWTGPSEPVVDLCAALRGLGHDVRLACSEPETDEGRTLPAESRKAGVPVAGPFRFRKRLALVSNFADARRLSRLVEQEGFDIVHAHTSLDHLLCAASLKFCRRKPPLLRTNHLSRPVVAAAGGRALLSQTSGGLFEYAQRFLEADRPWVRRTFKIDPALRLDRYALDVSGQREKFGFGADQFVVGMVLRVQKHRRIDVALEALRRAHKSEPRVRALIVGRGTRREELAVKPVRQMGLADVIKFTGYVKEGYLQTLASFDMLLFPRPGSDGTARALREAMVLGRPAVVTDFGMLGELVRHEETGYVEPLDPGRLAERIVQMARNPRLADALGRAAAQDARARFSLDRQAALVEQAYRQVLAPIPTSL